MTKNKLIPKLKPKRKSIMSVNQKYQTKKKSLKHNKPTQTVIPQKQHKNRNTKAKGQSWLKDSMLQTYQQPTRLFLHATVLVALLANSKKVVIEKNNQTKNDIPQVYVIVSTKSKTRTPYF